MKSIFLTLICTTLICCTKNTTPKPNAYLKLSYPKTQYQKAKPLPTFSFELSEDAIFNIEKENWLNIYYTKLKAEINITYQPVKNNLTKLVTDAEKLTYKHTLRADHIEMHSFENLKNNVFAKLFNVTGDVASPLQFQITDSTKHFLSGSLYFDARPNYDSILPAIDFLKKDIHKLIETLEWDNTTLK